MKRTTKQMKLSDMASHYTTVGEIQITIKPTIQEPDVQYNSLPERYEEKKPLQCKITCSRDSYAIAKLFYEQLDLSPSLSEYFGVIALNRANRVLGIALISIGGRTGTVVDPARVFQVSLIQNCASLVLFHNHPSGNLEPSEADLSLTKKLVFAGEILATPVLDHIICTHSSYYSMADEGQIT